MAESPAIRLRSSLIDLLEANNKHIDISIVIVNYNVKDFLAGCLKSISAASNNLSVETIVVDNNSSDGTIEYLEPLFTDVNFIQLEDNIGFGRANNLGFEIAKGKYILILNPDTILRSDTLDIMFDYMEQNKQCGISGCKVLNPDGSFQVACRRGSPTPWASFSKLFGLQRLFPKSPLFAQYNQLYKSIDETYSVDAVIGAFMFARADVIREVSGFDPEFFMYGEDLDLCRQVVLRGYSVDYVHTTSIIHFKGESTKRSSINDVMHFYEAMQIFSRKHFGKSHLFLLFLRIGIFIRSMLAYGIKYKRDFMFMFADLISINAALLIGTKIRFERFLGFPDYAYPTVFIVISAIFLGSMLSVCEYFEGKNSVRKSITAALISFFVLSSLTYFFPDYRFSRGVVLMSIGFTIGFVMLSRGIVYIFDKIAGKQRDRKVIVVGTGQVALRIAEKIKFSEPSNMILLGFVSTGKSNHQNTNLANELLGETSYLKRIVEIHKPSEIILADEGITSSDIINLMLENANSKVRFHRVDEYDDLIAAQIIEDISGIEPTVPKYNLSLFRYKTIKRIEDMVLSLLSLTIGLPFIIILNKSPKILINKLLKVLSGKYSFVGLYETKSCKSKIGKPGIIGPAAHKEPQELTDEAINKLNDYYIRHYNLTLDFDIIIKFLIRIK